MPLHFNDLDVVSDAKGLSSALIVPCNMCPAVTVAVREKMTRARFFETGIWHVGSESVRRAPAAWAALPRL